ncbi:MAG: TatD family hydrolase [Proteobacteria bacterium]|nr:TatD family hydrolase [Pseudomonadota bacterium]
MRLIDTHCHLDFPAFDADRHQLLQNCQKLGIYKLIIPGVCQKNWQRVIDLSHDQKWLYPALGIHPCFVDEHGESSITELKDFILKQPRVLAVGETGLDFFMKGYNEPQQRFFFEQQVDLANTLNRPLILHVRKAHDQVASTLKKKGFVYRGIVHCYSGSYQQAGRYLDLGFKLGIGGVVTYPRSTRLHKIVRELPLDSFVLETDAPDIPPLGKERQRNSPEYLTRVFDSFTEFRNESKSKVMDTLLQNTISLFPELKE